MMGETHETRLQALHRLSFGGILRRLPVQATPFTTSTGVLNAFDITMIDCVE
jgi:hypothetical protein